MSESIPPSALTAQVLPPGFVLPEFFYIPLEEIRGFDEQPREYFDPVALDELGENIKEEGQIMPAIAIRVNPPMNGKRFELVDGERRWRACKLKGITHFLIMIHPKVKTKDDQFVMSVMANFFRLPTTHVEGAKSVARLKAMNMSNETIAKKMGQSVSWVYQHHSLLRLHPDIIKLIDPPTPKKDRIPYMGALQLVDLPHDAQLEMAGKMTKEKTSLVKTKHLLRKVAEAAGVTQKLKLPKKAFRDLRKIIRHANEGIEDTLDQPSGFFAQVIKGASPQELKKFLQDLDDTMSGFEMLKEEIEKHAGVKSPDATK